MKHVHRKPLSKPNQPKPKSGSRYKWTITHQARNVTIPGNIVAKSATEAVGKACEHLRRCTTFIPGEYIVEAQSTDLSPDDPNSEIDELVVHLSAEPSPSIGGTTKVEDDLRHVTIHRRSLEDNLEAQAELAEYVRKFYVGDPEGPWGGCSSEDADPSASEIEWAVRLLARYCCTTGHELGGVIATVEEPDDFASSCAREIVRDLILFRRGELPRELEHWERLAPSLQAEATRFRAALQEGS